jgi:hypothetical protein
MTRNSSIFILVLAMLGATTATAAAAGSDGYQSVNAITGGDGGQPQSKGFSSVSAVVGSDSSDRSVASSAPAQPGSLNATLGANGLPQESPTAGVVATGGDGFDWSDALVGAFTAFGLALMTLVAARLVARHRRATVEGHA